MFIRMRDSHSRSIGKAVTWRIVGSLDTFCITFLITGNLVSAGSVASLETVSKIVLFYLHERAWQKIPLVRRRAASACPSAEAAASGPAAAQLAPSFGPATPADAMASVVRVRPGSTAHRAFQGSDS